MEGFNMTAQPTWQLVFATDDSALYVDTSGVYPPELKIVDEINDAPARERFQVYRFACEGLQAYRDDDGSIVLCFRDYDRTWSKGARAYREWYQDSLADVARSCGRSLLSLVRDLISDDPRALASAYRDIADYRGAVNFDQYPETWSEYEMATWPERQDPEADPDAYADCLAGEDAREEFARGYISCALWCGVMAYRCDEHDDTSDCSDECEPELVSSDASHDESDLADAAETQLRADADAFFTSNVRELIASGLTMDQAGHDFWLTRNRHGAGFWDHKHRGANADAALDRLTETSHAYGSMDLLADSDGTISVM